MANFVVISYILRSGEHDLADVDADVLRYWLEHGYTQPGTPEGSVHFPLDASALVDVVVVDLDRPNTEQE